MSAVKYVLESNGKTCTILRSTPYQNEWINERCWINMEHLQAAKLLDMLNECVGWEYGV